MTRPSVGRHGSTVAVSGSGQSTRSLSSTFMNPAMDDPSKLTPSAKARGSSLAKSETFFWLPKISQNVNFANLTSLSSTKLRMSCAVRFIGTSCKSLPLRGKPQILERPTLSGRAFRAGVRNRKRRMAIVKGCNLTPGCVFTVRAGARPVRKMAWGGRAVACGETSHPVGAHPICARQPAAPCGRIREPPLQKAREKITRYRTAYGCSRAGASNPHRRCSRPRRRRHAGHPSRG